MGFQDFIQRIRLVAYRAGAGRESAPAPSTPVKPDRLEFLRARPLGSDLRAVTRRAALGRFDARERAVGSPGDAGGVEGARHADVIKGGIGDVTDLQGDAAGGGTREGDEFARKRWSWICKNEGGKIVVGQWIARVGSKHRG